MDFRVYYTAIREKRAELGAQFSNGSCAVVSVNRANNGACEVTLDNAARLLVEGTHRLATDSEIDAFHADQGLRRAATGAGSLDSVRAQLGITARGKVGKE
jgi:hypothetical protein